MTNDTKYSNHQSIKRRRSSSSIQYDSYFHHCNKMYSFNNDVVQSILVVKPFWKCIRIVVQYVLFGRNTFVTINWHLFIIIVLVMILVDSVHPFVCTTNTITSRGYFIQQSHIKYRILPLPIMRKRQSTSAIQQQQQKIVFPNRINLRWRIYASILYHLPNDSMNDAWNPMVHDMDEENNVNEHMSQEIFIKTSQIGNNNKTARNGINEKQSISMLVDTSSSSALQNNTLFQSVPRHIGIVMDGNTRWSKQNNVPTSNGHYQGATVLLHEIIPYLSSIPGIQYCTVYGFSTENWKRSTNDIQDVLRVIEQTAWNVYNKILSNDEMYTLYQKKIRFRTLGNLHDERIPTSLRTILNQLEAYTGSIWDTNNNNNSNDNNNNNNNILTVSLAINYGGRQDILHATQRYMEDVIETYLNNNDGTATLQSLLDEIRIDKHKKNDDNNNNNNNDKTDVYQHQQQNQQKTIPVLTEELFHSYMDTCNIPYPDLIIRTGGESRLSNFLLWDCAYSELYITNTLWPDTNTSTIEDALVWYSNRQRRYGGQISLSTSSSS